MARSPTAAPGTRVTLPRALSKLGYCSRTQAEKLVAGGHVTVGGRIVTDLSTWVDIRADHIEVDGKPISAEAKVYLMLNKPRGLVTTRDDPEGRETVFSCLEHLDIPHVSPVGRLDKASEGLLLFTNDTVLAQRLLEPESDIAKTYHVQTRGRPTEADLARMRAGILDDGELLKAKRVRVLREADRTCWLEFELCEGKNREIRRMLETIGFECLRLVRVSFDDLVLGDLEKGKARFLTEAQVAALKRRTGRT
ncbi:MULTISPECIES: pseudouridine synthase [Alphaproteobacteria]|uniref:Pseudouridine synthase n=2 Tax=Alphaproteobacteria TaxID=28211 RepID=A0A512HL40_9HYPH|nr:MULTISPECIES: pseudouridine synthase [Alphaproteobacteria]GEO86163.1 pseudouridine synthase [Ciceribacter naphthalenivorans]GLR22730.1 pseudouridine synthase [Ciceribacter naphthalenivorans]GLT05586.1 pseudouridine synthase [Sphingomonas psychrolutea]